MALENMKNEAFSVHELKEAKIDKRTLLYNGYRVDYRRGTCVAENVEILKVLKLEPLPKKGEKPAKIKPKAIKKLTGKGVAESKETESKSVDKAKPVVEPTASSMKLKVTKLDELTDITAGQLQKFKDLGIETPEKFISEDVKQLATLIKTTQKQIKAWMAQIKGE
jgi:hypothetical protein